MTFQLENLVALAALPAEFFTLVFLRIGAAMALLPTFGERSIPVRIKLALTLCLTVIVVPAVIPDDPPSDGGSDFLVAAAAEVIVGLAFGIALRLMVHALQILGTIAANMASLSQLFGGMGAEPQPAMAQVLIIGGLALAASTGLHVKVAFALIETYRLFPPGLLPGFRDLAGWLTSRGSEAFGLAFALAAPFTAASLVANLALGAINRAMPQFMAAFVGAPATVWAAIALLAVTAPFILKVWSEALDRLMTNPFGSG